MKTQSELEEYLNIIGGPWSVVIYANFKVGSAASVVVKVPGDRWRRDAIRCDLDRMRPIGTELTVLRMGLIESMWRRMFGNKLKVEKP